ncbi:MAG: GldG family protein [Verrucomicrobia bacterium]|nr:GldG family protein [Verrucomicrobiota bacterium]
MPAPVEEEPTTPDAAPAEQPAAAAAETKPAPAARPHRIHRGQIASNVVLQVVFAALIVAFVNYLGFKHFRRFDYSRDRKYALSARTKNVLASLKEPVKLIVFMSDNALLKSDAVELVREYRNVQPNLVQTETVDPYRDIARATVLARTYKLGKDDNAIIVDAGGRQKLVQQDALADVEGGTDMFGNTTTPTVTAWKGESAVTGALLEVVEGKKNVVYYLRGHAEPELGQRGAIGILQTYIERDNIQLKDFNLANTDTVPTEASALLLAGPKYDLSEREIKALDNYWSTRQGRIFILLNPDGETPRLNQFLAKLGITPDDDRVMAVITLGMTKEGARIVQRAPYVAGEMQGGGPIAERLRGVNVLFPGSTQSLTIDPPRVGPAGIKVESLVQAIEGYWGEMDYRDPDSPAGQQMTPGRDKDKNIVLAATAERGALEDPRVQVNTARLIVVGNARFIDNQSLDQNDADFALGALNWLLNRERSIGISPKEIKTFSVNFTPQQEKNIFIITTLLIPGLFALLGVGVWWWRRA